MSQVEQRRNRRTGTYVSLIDNRDRQFQSDGEDWITVCEEHGATCTHRTRVLARSFMAAPEEWCEDCRNPYEHMNQFASGDSR